MLAVTSRLAVIALTLGAFGPALLAEAAPATGDKAENFRLTTHEDKSWELHYQGDSKAVALLSFDPECPVSREAAAGLESVRAGLESNEVSAAAINVRPDISREQVAAIATELGLNYPILMDPTQHIAKSLGFEHAAEGLIIDPANGWKIVYKGAADSQGKDVLDSHLAGQTVVPAVATEPAKGALINYQVPAEVSYAKDIVPILQSKCVSCHHDGGLGPFAMSDYKKVHGWADMIRETVITRRMPPWHADPEMGEYMNSRALSAEEERKLLAWIAAGSPQGEEEDPLPAVQPPAGQQAWQLGPPDHIVTLPAEEELPAEGIIDYRYIPVEANIDEDKWLRAVEVRTNNLPVLHHALIFVTYPKEYRHIQPEARSGLNGYFAAYLPGARVYPLPSDSAIFLPKGSVFTFQMHYNSTGKPETERCEMGLWFYDGVPDRVVKIEAANDTDFSIPPNAPDHEARARFTFDSEAEILGLSPHMHYRGSRFKFAANFPDGDSQTLLNVPFYEFDWQPMYLFAQPLSVPEGTEIACVGAFDNTRFNRKNPEPNQWVGFGEQSFEEMFIGYVQYAVPRDPAVYKPQEIDPSEFVGLGENITEESIVGMQFRIRRNIVVEFKEGGKVESADGAIKGKYTFTAPNKVTVNSIFGAIDFVIVGDEMFMGGRPLRRVG